MSEGELQEKILEKLRQRYGVQNVLKTAGASEHGVDIVFIKTNGNEFDEELVIGLQLKVEANMSATVVQKSIGQATVALGHKFMVGDNHGRRLDLVYIVNDGDYTHQALQYLDDAKQTTNSLRWLDRSHVAPYLVDSISTTDFTQESPDA